MHATRQSASAIAKAINRSNEFWLTMAATCALQMHYALKKTQQLATSYGILYF